MINSTSLIPHKRYYRVADTDPVLDGPDIIIRNSDPGRVPYVATRVIYADRCFVILHIHYRSHVTSDQYWRYLILTGDAWRAVTFHALSTTQRTILARHWRNAGGLARPPSRRID